MYSLNEVVRFQDDKGNAKGKILAFNQEGTKAFLRLQFPRDGKLALVDISQLTKVEHERY